MPQPGCDSGKGVIRDVQDYPVSNGCCLPAPSILQLCIALNQLLLPDRNSTCRALWLPQNRILLSARVQQKAIIEIQNSWTARISGKCLTISREQHRNIYQADLTVHCKSDCPNDLEENKFLE